MDFTFFLNFISCENHITSSYEKLTKLNWIVDVIKYPNGDPMALYNAMH